MEAENKPNPLEFLQLANRADSGAKQHGVDSVATVRVKASHPSQGEFIVINEDDYDPERHELYEGDAPRRRAVSAPAPQPTKAAKPGRR